jgi:hypothetical protein
MACRRHFSCHLRPVSDRNVWDGIRSLCGAGPAEHGLAEKNSDSEMLHAMPTALPSLTVTHVLSCRPMMSDIMMKWRAGATAAVNCGVCQAGTYGTGSGLSQDAEGNDYAKSC